jgi:hypothetical protein
MLPLNNKGRKGLSLKIMTLVTYTRDTVGDWGQSIVQFGGDDKAGICVGTDTSKQLSFCALLINFATLF